MTRFNRVTYINVFAYTHASIKLNVDEIKTIFTDNIMHIDYGSFIYVENEILIYIKRPYITMR